MSASDASPNAARAPNPLARFYAFALSPAGFFTLLLVYILAGIALRLWISPVLGTDEIEQALLANRDIGIRPFNSQAEEPLAATSSSGRSPICPAASPAEESASRTAATRSLNRFACHSRSRPPPPPPRGLPARRFALRCGRLTDTWTPTWLGGIGLIPRPWRSAETTAARPRV